MKKTLRTTVSLLLTLCMALSLGGVSALAEGDLPTITETVAVSTDNGGAVTVTVGEKEYTQAGEPAATAVTITPATDETPATVGIAANIATWDKDSHGVEASDSTVTVGGGVSTDMEDSHGVNAANSEVTVGGGVSTTGNDSNGVNAADGSTVKVTGDVSTSNSNSHGVEAANSEVTVTGGVTTLQDGSHGVNAGNSEVTVGGNVSVNGDSESHGVYAANGSTVTVTGGVSTKGNDNSYGVNADNSEVTVGGGVSTEGEDSDGVNAANGSTVKVTGGVSTTGNESDGVQAKDNSTITVEGGVSTTGVSSDGVRATENGTVTVEGSVSTTSMVSRGVYANNSTVTVKKDANGNGGDVSTTGIGSDGVAAYNNSTVTVEGSVSTTGDDSQGVFANNSTVEVGGDVTGSETGIQVLIYSGDTAGSTVVVEGTVSATKTSGQAIKLQVPDGATAETIKEVLPEIIVQSIDSDADYVVCTGASPDDNAAIAKAVKDSIKYIVDVESKKESGRASTVTVDLVKYGTSEAADTYETADGKILAVATATTQLKLGVDQTKGALIGVAVTDANGAQTELEKNENGDWVITVPAGGFKDGFKITATVKEKEPQPWFGPVWPSFGGETYTEVVQKRDPLSVEGDTLLIDLTETGSVTLTAAALRGYRDSGVKTVEILVKNGSFSVEMGDLLNALGSAENVAFTSHGETLDISADGASLATLVLGAGA